MYVLSLHIYEKLVEILKDRRSNFLEIGSFNGFGIAYLSKLYPNYNFVSIDPFIEDGYTSWVSEISAYEKMNNIKENFIKNTSGCLNIKHYENTTEEVQNLLTSDELRNMDISIVLIDGDHHKDFVKIDYNFAMKVIGDKSGLIIFDDMHVDGVSEAFEDFKIENSKRLQKIEHYYNDVGLQYSIVHLKENI